MPKDPASDLVIAYVVDPPLGYLLYSCENGSLMIAIPGVSLEELTAAPGDLSSYRCDGEVILDLAYVVATSDGIYAKFSVQTFTNDWIIEYYVQTDGTRSLVDPIEVKATTWSHIKALYGCPH